MRNGVERGESAKGRKVKFARLLGAALNTGIINVVERRALAQLGPLFRDHLWVLERDKMVKRESGTGRQSDSVNEKLSWKEGRDTGESGSCSWGGGPVGMR